MHVVYMCISVLMNHDCTTHPFLPFITITTKLLSNRDDWLSLFQFYRKTFLRSVDPKQPKNVKFSLWSFIETFSQGEVRDFSGEVQKFSGKVQNDLRGGAHLHLKIRPWISVFHRASTVVTRRHLEIAYITSTSELNVSCINYIQWINYTMR
jgi:hypothetical protein